MRISDLYSTNRHQTGDQRRLRSAVAIALVVTAAISCFLYSKYDSHLPPFDSQKTIECGDAYFRERYPGGRNWTTLTVVKPRHLSSYASAKPGSKLLCASSVFPLDDIDLQLLESAKGDKHEWDAIMNSDVTIYSVNADGSVAKLGTENVAFVQLK